MRLSVSLFVLPVLSGIVIGGAASAGELYEPIALAPAVEVQAPPGLEAAAADLITAVEKDDVPAIAALIADTVLTVDGGLELGLPRFTETIGPFESAEDKLTELAWRTGGGVQMASSPDDKTPYAIYAERDFIKYALTDGRVWGSDPMVPDAICTYGYRSFDVDGVAALAEHMGIYSSSFFYVDAPTPLHAEAEAGSETIFTLEPDRLYALDYETDALGYWIAVHLPEGGVGFLDYDVIDMQKPFAVGICFDETDAGWQMVAQVSTSQ
ncbi:hypothetical protein [Devosia sp.]|uniref:hypothetical protein n=1 Tax=Devosia sp. TaxID=1871048 RepID=UPI003A923F45